MKLSLFSVAIISTVLSTSISAIKIIDSSSDFNNCVPEQSMMVTTQTNLAQTIP